jgi:gliding motility-associated-like protein
MKKGFIHTILFVFILGLMIPGVVNAQISAPASAFTEQTRYPVFEETDSIYIFCTEEDYQAAALVAETFLSGLKTYEWQQYNPITQDFEFYYSEQTESSSSRISGLPDGCFRVVITKEDTTETHRAWVFNNWFEAEAKVTESTCDYFKLESSFRTAELIYYDLISHTGIELYKDIQVEWKEGHTGVARVYNPQIFDPPTRDTEYTFSVYDRFGCSGEARVTYISIVTRAAFEVEADFNSGEWQGEAPMEVTFINTSENGTPGAYEWYFFRNLDEIKKESETTSQPVDSFLFIAYNDELIHTYEKTGTYMVKLVSQKISSYHIHKDSLFDGVCTDTVYMEDFIVTDTSYFDVPNVFTPNGDGTNDQFVVKFWSMMDAKVTIVNRWGKKVHFWEKTNINRFEGTWMESVWDGRIGGRYASPGVYYYVAEGKGRDGKNRWAHGFFHLFRGKE